MKRARADLLLSAALAVVVMGLVLGASFLGVQAAGIVFLAAYGLSLALIHAATRWGAIARALARRLGGACEEADTHAEGGWRVTARVDGSPVAVDFDGAEQALTCSLRGAGPLAFLHVRARELRLDATVRSLLGRERSGELYDVEGVAAKYAQSREVAHVLDELFRLGWEEVTVEGDGVTARAALTSSGPWVPGLWPGRLERAVRLFARLARACDRRALAVGEPGRFAWAPAGGDVRCPYCHDGLDPGAPDLADCERCATVHHAACLAEAGGCTVFGCRTRRASARDKA